MAIVAGKAKSRLIRSFDELGRGDVSFAGGKGANLGELTRAGFVFGIRRRRTFIRRVRHARRPTRADRRAARRPRRGRRRSALRRAADEVRTMVAAASVPESVERELRQAYTGAG